MTYAMLPARRVREAAQKARDNFDPKKHDLDPPYADTRRAAFGSLIGLCLAADAASTNGPGMVQVSVGDFSWIADYYELGT